MTRLVSAVPGGLPDLLGCCRAARGGAQLGPAVAARAAAEIARNGDADFRRNVRGLLASLAAKGAFPVDLHVYDKALREHDDFLSYVTRAIRAEAASASKD